MLPVAVSPSQEHAGSKRSALRDDELSLGRAYVRDFCYRCQPYNRAYTVKR